MIIISRYLAFIVTLGIHFLWVSNNLEPPASTSMWIDDQTASQSGYEIYFLEGEYYMGLSYAFSLLFVTYVLTEAYNRKKNNKEGMVASLSISSFIYFFGCFMMGCCGSPMAAVYISLFGSSFLGFTKPFIFSITMVSIILSYWWVVRKNKKACC